MVDLLERLRTRGWRMTPQRRVVAEVLRGEHVHLSAETIHARARRRLPEISLATVYNTLNELVAMGELLEVSPGYGPKRYDPNVVDHHQHLVCLGCSAILDVHPAGEADLVLPVDEQHGYEVLDVDVVFRGRCPACRR
jgi:Fur family transcriptional regulator, stress-responsive regulator